MFGNYILSISSSLVVKVVVVIAVVELVVVVLFFTINVCYNEVYVRHWGNNKFPNTVQFNSKIASQVSKLKTDHRKS